MDMSSVIGDYYESKQWTVDGVVLSKIDEVKDFTFNIKQNE